MVEKEIIKSGRKTSVFHLLLIVFSLFGGSLIGIVFTWAAVFPIYRKFFGGGEFLSGALAGLMMLFVGAVVGGFIGLAIPLRLLK